MARARIAATIAVSALITSVAPVMATDAVACLNAWGMDHPAAWCEPGYVGAVTPLDQPFAHGERGDLYVRGIATPATKVVVSISDGEHTIFKTVSSTATTDTGAGKPAGSFNAEFGAGRFTRADGNTCATGDQGCDWMIGIQDLGTHRARAGASPFSRDASDRGESILTVTATTSAGSLSTTVRKYAATYGDLDRPVVMARSGQASITFPPARWCNFIAFASPQGVPDGNCSRPVPCKLTIGPVTQNTNCPSGQVNISGTATDGGAWNQGSEIADVRLVVLQGDDVLKDISILDGRRSFLAPFHHVEFWADYGSNIETCDSIPNSTNRSGCYYFNVTITDAWGYTSTYSSGPVAVTPI